MALQFNQTGGDNSKVEKQTLISPQHTIEVTETETGHEVDVNPQIIETINNKQDKIIVGNFQTNAILSMSLLERTGSQSAITNRVIGNYVPLIEIQCVNNGKSQFEFSVFSREDSMNYYGRYLLTTWNGSNPTCKFELLDYCNDNGNDVFNASNIIAIKLNPKANNQLARYLICKKIISTSGVLDAYFVNILSQDLGFCYSKKYYTRSPQVYYNPLEVIQINQSVTSWQWYFDYNMPNWNNYAGLDGLEKEDEFKNNPALLQSADLANTDSSTDDYVVYYYPTPAIIKPLIFNEYTKQQLDYKGVENAKVNTLDYWIDGIEGLNPNFDDRYRTIQLECQIITGTEMAQYDWSKFAYVNFSVIDNDKCYFVFRTLRTGLTQFGFIIETPTPDNY